MVTICADGFNGAASARSRKCALNLALYVAGVASMGPRARARGNRPILLDFPHRCSFWLQWGRERALAEMNPAAGQRLPAIFASMGPRARARGNPPIRFGFTSGSSCFNGAASARSRKYRAPTTADDAAAGFNGAASARSRKCGSSIWAGVRPTMLQWGRERALAEIQPRECRPVVFGLLQWGRERALAEICRQENAQGEGQGASMGPRARARGNTVTSESFGVLIRLQWGRERALAEMPSSSTAAAWVGFASMGPRARARGNSLPHTLFNFQRP